MPIVLYARVSTSEQTIQHQEAQARAAGFAIDKVVADNGVSGVATRLVERSEGRRLFDLLRAGGTLVVRWVNRLGRNYADVCDTILEFMRRGGWWGLPVCDGRDASGQIASVTAHSADGSAGAGTSHEGLPLWARRRLRCPSSFGPSSTT